MPAITTRSERTGHWIKMRRSPARSSRLEASNRTQSLVDFITTTSESRFSVHTTDSKDFFPGNARISARFLGVARVCKRVFHRPSAVYSTPIKSRPTISDGGPRLAPAMPLLIPRWDLRCSMLGRPLCQQRAPRRHIGSLAAVLERQWWADAPVNDGLFVRRDA